LLRMHGPYETDHEKTDGGQKGGCYR